MAKTKKEIPINKVPLLNVLTVPTCKTCNGNPPITPINLPDFEGTKCDTCFHVITFKKKQDGK